MKNSIEKFGIGTVHITNEGYSVEVIEKLNKNKRTVVFLDEYRAVLTCNLESVLTGAISNPYRKSVCGIGFHGVGKYKSSENNKKTLAYKKWHGILCRVTNIEIKNNPYKNTAICEEWHNFQNFGEWFDKNYPAHIENIKFHIDKDLLQYEVEDKIYSPNTCVFLPECINVFLTNKNSRNKTGIIGVSWCKRDKKWKSSIKNFQGKHVNLGRFSDINEASLAYQKARSEQAEHAKDYLRSLNYLSEEVIQLIK